MRTFLLFQFFISTTSVLSQPPRGGGGGQGGGGSQISCPSDGLGYTGDSNYIGSGPKAAPLRGTIGCIGSDTVTPFTDKLLIYGPFEAGFSNSQLSQFFGCSSSTASIPGGIDTLIAEKMAAYECGLHESAVSILDDCGGHANPYHYHEKMTCLYTSDVSTQHSTRIGTALDGNGIYGKYISGGVVPSDLDACGGRYGVTPDSNGQVVYYYVVQDVAPFTVGCFGPVKSVQECRSLYATCGDGDEIAITTASGTMMYDPDCPCFDKNNGMSNIPSNEIVEEESSTTVIATTSNEMINEATTSTTAPTVSTSTSSESTKEAMTSTTAKSTVPTISTSKEYITNSRSTRMPQETTASASTKYLRSTASQQTAQVKEIENLPIEPLESSSSSKEHSTLILLITVTLSTILM